ncbi:MAG: hypothetical protein COV44_08320 [Deltaproteobacteria bacterium CG11_big_fil_rev_8_21_14_0_20_45_16]|nr:MAG: hypothetical protein COV44_08320 [Deltaproteobacteria bacterium CG11_big_fil_rev_8_21_14_0_20_45_16]
MAKNHDYQELSCRFSDYAKAHFVISDATCFKTRETLLPTGRSLMRLSQIHSAAGFEVRDHSLYGKEGDWLWTKIPNIPIGVFVADCTAILMAGENAEGSFVAAIHAGWRGTAAGIIESVIETIQPEGKFDVWLSPSISQKNYEVSQEVWEALGSDIRPYVRPTRVSHALLDLKSFQVGKLKSFAARIWNYPLCSFEQPEFFSYRQMKGKLESRHLAWIELK